VRLSGDSLGCLGYLLFLPPGGPSAVFVSAFQNHKISFGSTAFDFSQPTVWVLMIYGFFWYLQRYPTDQTLVQRYLSAKSDRAAVQGVAMGALLSVPVWTLFMLIGTCTWTFYHVTDETLPAYITKADQAFPHSLSTHLPAGISGLVMAALIWFGDVRPFERPERLFVGGSGGHLPSVAPRIHRPPVAARGEVDRDGLWRSPYRDRAGPLTHSNRRAIPVVFGLRRS
jgi:hypothetical protein